MDRHIVGTSRKYPEDAGRSHPEEVVRGYRQDVVRAHRQDVVRAHRQDVVRTHRQDWRERLFWRSLACALIVFLLLGLVALAQWGEVALRASAIDARGRRHATGPIAELRIRPGPPSPSFGVALPTLPATAGALRERSLAKVSNGQSAPATAR